MFVSCSPSLALLLLLVLGLSLFVLCITLLHGRAHLGHFDVVDLIVILLHVPIYIVAVLTVAFVLTTLGSGFDTDVLRRVGLLIELVGEVLGHDAATVFVILLHDDGFQLLAHSVHDLAKAEGHRLISELADVGVELPVNLLDDTVGP